MREEGKLEGLQLAERKSRLSEQLLAACGPTNVRLMVVKFSHFQPAFKIIRLEGLV